MSVYVLGSINLDTVARVAQLPRPGETVLAKGVERFVGGKGANQAVACARQGQQTHLIGRLGADEAGQTLSAALADAGVILDDVRTSADQPTGQAYITVSEAGENAIVVSLGANAEIGVEDVATAHLPDAKVLLTQLECPLPAISAFFDYGAHCSRILNAAPAHPEARALFDLTDILVVNETELAAYAGLSRVTTTIAEAEAAGALIRKRPDQVIIATLGRNGALIMDAQQTVHVPGHDLPAVDTTGAGDCFCGALAAGLAASKSLIEAVEWANGAAGLSVTRRGAARSMPTAREVQSLIAP